ncbi:MAG: adenine phosphoribosyltransferase [Acidobacteriota bacterium]|nr:adenine phosphoribosyltransferase [Acidobacteriota bacterium]
MSAIEPLTGPVPRRPAAAGDLGARLRELVRDVPDFPRPGIVFKDITPLLADRHALEGSVAALADLARELRPEFVVAAEARGFLLGAPLALALGAGFLPARKPGKLPGEAVRVSYALEYGSDALELHTGALPRGARVLVHDDLLATGGTARALCELVERAGGVVAGVSFLVELAELRGRSRIAGHEVAALLTYGEA